MRLQVYTLPLIIGWCDMAETITEYHYASDSSGLICYGAKHHHTVAADEQHVINTLQWHDGELDMWLGAHKWLRAVGGAYSRHLDIGCGFGRITIKFGWLFGITTCLEADAVHMGHAKRNVANMSKLLLLNDRPQHVEYVQSRFLEYDVGSKQYHAITCIQVIQHIPTGEVLLWFIAAHAALINGGVFALATTYSAVPKLTIEGTPVSKERFNRRANGLDVAYWGSSKLAVRYYGHDELRLLAEAAGFVVLDHGHFLYSRGRPTHQWIVLTRASPQGAKLPVAVPTRVREIFYSSMELLAMQKIKDAHTSGVCHKARRSTGSRNRDATP